MHRVAYTIVDQRAAGPGNAPRRMRQRAIAGFSLVEVTVAIGIFAFVAVGVLGLLPAALKQRSDSSREMRAVMIAEELFSSVRASQSITNIALRRGTRPEDVFRVNLATERAAIGYSAQSSVPYFAWWPRSEKAEYKDPDKVWLEGNLDSAALGNNIDLIALIQATNITGFPGLYQLMVQVRSPATVPLVSPNDSSRTNTPPVTFTTFLYSP